MTDAFLPNEELEDNEPVQELPRESVKAFAAAPKEPKYLRRHVARISNRYNYNHYYLVPASTYLNHGSDYIRVMQDEGCDLSDIQITFEVQEIKIP